LPRKAIKALSPSLPLQLPRPSFDMREGVKAAEVVGPPFSAA
jgi:hypothetical protein